MLCTEKSATPLEGLKTSTSVERLYNWWDFITYKISVLTGPQKKVFSSPQISNKTYLKNPETVPGQNLAKPQLGEQKRVLPSEEGSPRSAKVVWLMISKLLLSRAQILV